MPCKQLTVQEYNQLMIDNPGAVGSTTRETCCCPPEPGWPPTECCICTTVYGWTQYRDSENLNYRGAPGETVENPLGFCMGDFTEYGPGPRYIDESYQGTTLEPFIGKWAYDVLCRKDTFIDCSFWLQECGETYNFPPSEGFGGGTVTGFCYTAGSCVDGRCANPG